MSWLRNIIELREKLLAGKDVSLGFIEFDINERGKRRHIKSVHFKERVAQRALCDNALVPVLSRSLIHDNGASLEGKGITFARNRLKHHLHQYFRRHGSNDGAILMMDFSGYFDNIQHGPVYSTLRAAFHDGRIFILCKYFIEPFGEKSLGIGSQVSQILAVSYRNPIDHFMKEQRRIWEYGCYMDDSYACHSSKEYLKESYWMIAERCAARGIRLNTKKTQIVKLSKGFTYMKGKYYLLSTGKVVLKPCRDNITRERRKLRKFRRFLDEGKMTLPQITCSYNSHRGYISKGYNSHNTVRSTDKLFHELFGYDVKINRKEKF